MVHDDLIDSLPNTSIVTISRLKSLGICTYWDLINFFPFRYEDYSIISKINRLQEGETTTVIGKIIDSKYQITRTRLRIQKFVLQDETGSLELNWYNQSYLLSLLKKGLTVAVAGEIKRFGRKLSMTPKDYEILYSNESIDWSKLRHTGRIVPVYSETKGLSSRTIREKMSIALGKMDIEEFLPQETIITNGLIDEETSYKSIHFPKNPTLMKKARERLSFDELFTIQLTNTLVRNEWKKETVGNRFTASRDIEEKISGFIEKLPFQLTSAQMRVIEEITEDLKKEKPMNRFLQGEVGSGKTVVAAIACYIAHLNGFQSLFMAPTEILANQHFQTISNLFKSYPMQIGLITGAKNSKFKIQNSKFDIIVGTHALIQKNTSYKKVGLVIVDEQHRFGVRQRAILKEKGINPHLLSMTATPIPRTVALTMFGELDMSIIDEMPIGRLPIKTYFITKHKRNDCYEWIKKQIKELDIQVFIVCPFIEESEIETMKSVKAAKKEVELLQKAVFPEYQLGLIHGKMKSKEKDEIMSGFKDKKYRILVATPVVEVGIDIQNATIILIEGAERFGLAQLHQLRGRVGRGDKQSYCFLFTEKESQEITRRLQFVSKTRSGNILAEKDLELRGAGTIYGTLQHGIMDLKIASLSDYVMIEKTRKAVNYFMGKHELGKFPELKKRVKKYEIEQITRD